MSTSSSSASGRSQALVGAPHRELFDVADGALLWQDDEVAYLLQGAGTKANAAQLAVQIG